MQSYLKKDNSEIATFQNLKVKSIIMLEQKLQSNTGLFLGGVKFRGESKNFKLN